MEKRPQSRDFQRLEIVPKLLIDTMSTFAKISLIPLIELEQKTFYLRESDDSICGCIIIIILKMAIEISVFALFIRFVLHGEDVA